MLHVPGEVPYIEELSVTEMLPLVSEEVVPRRISSIVPSTPGEYSLTVPDAVKPDPEIVTEAGEYELPFIVTDDAEADIWGSTGGVPVEVKVTDTGEALALPVVLSVTVNVNVPATVVVADALNVPVVQLPSPAAVWVDGALYGLLLTVTSPFGVQPAPLRE
jgi:hypothetical protein